MSITKVFNPRLNQYTYYTKENGQLIPLNYEDGLKQGLAVLEQIREKVKQYYDRVNEITDMSVFEKGQSLAYDTVLAVINKTLKEQNE